MTRRKILGSFAATAAGAGLAVAGAAKSHSSIGPSFIHPDDATTLYYRDWGTGKPVVFVHSWGVNADLWQYQMIHLADQGIRCIAYDRRGHGRSSDPGHGYNLDRLADDLAAVIGQLDLRDAALVGHSLGCSEIVRYLSRHGSNRISRVALVSPTMPLLLKTADNPDGIDGSYFLQVRARFTADFPGWLAENSRAFFVPETSQAMLDWGISLMTQASLKALIDCNRIGTETDFRPELSKVKVPALIVQGDKDASAPLERTGRKTAALIPASQLLVYEGAPHGLMFTHTARLNADLLSFLRT